MLFGGRFDIVTMLIRVPVLLLALVCHEVAHGFAAYRLGDSTAKRDGRLSLNPLRHIDPIGFAMMILFGFGWARPVMVSPLRLKDPKKDMAVISSAGPLANILLAFLSMLILYPVLSLTRGGASDWVYRVLIELLTLNISLGVFNLLPIPPLDGFKIFGSFLPNRLYFSIMRFERYGFIVLIILIYSGAISGILGTLVNAAFRALLFVVSHIYFFL